MISRFLLCALLIFNFAQIAKAQSQGQFELSPGLTYLRHSDRFDVVEDPIRELETIDSEPLFPELPFLKLREGDRIVRAQVLSEQVGKGVDADAPKKWDISRFYLVRDGKYRSLYVGGDGQTLDFAASILPFFRWEQTRVNADALFQETHGWADVTIEHLKDLDARLQPDYGEYLSPGLSDFVGEKPAWTPGLLSETGGDTNQRFIYAGFYRSFDYGICQYRWVLDDDEWTEERRVLIRSLSPPAMPPNIPMQQMASLVPDKTDYLAQMPSDFRCRYTAHKARYDNFFQIVNDVLRPAP